MDVEAALSGLPNSVLWRLRCFLDDLLKGSFKILMDVVRQ